jgi:hypothetical protein
VVQKMGSYDCSAVMQIGKKYLNKDAVGLE